MLESSDFCSEYTTQLVLELLMEHSRTGVDRSKLLAAQKLIAEAFGEDSPEALERSADRFARWQEAALSTPREAYDPDDVRLYERAPGSHVGLITIKVTAYSSCEHHYAPSWLKATIGYVPDRSIIGYSKMVKMFRHFACRYTMDERLCDEFVEEFRTKVAPKGVGVLLRGKHFCVLSRGGSETDFPTVTALWGVLRNDESVRREFYQHGFASWSDGA
ncbi:GTP cyclohydrolase I [Verrucosispora sp. WMMA2121]|uniref:GTP cyclohydrolase I n=1 Tax=Verrucosispora sp. WMMA2121 TaxID=3015164 RepID=UPI0022B6628F|nr:GTP cyclohydrolase I [Verrucosispora sp. WMMA2121]MCZ7422960.1 GTP cyclohydrolase I [Verrucosispora sp. WMMA2121]